MSNEEITITFEEDFVATRGSTYTLVFNDLVSFAATEAEHAERARIRTELIEWLVGTILPCDAGLVNGRRIVDEIDRICPKE